MANLIVNLIDTHSYEPDLLTDLRYWSPREGCGEEAGPLPNGSWEPESGIGQSIMAISEFTHPLREESLSRA